MQYFGAMSNSCWSPQQQIPGPQSAGFESLRARSCFARQLRPALRCCSSFNDDSSGGSKPEPCRRLLLLSAAACISAAQSQLGNAAAESLVPSLPAPPAIGLAIDSSDGTKQLVGKPGFRLSYPSDWVVAFNRDVRNEQNDQRRAIALLGNFKSFETASVQWLNPDRLGQSGAAILRRHFGLRFMRRLRLIGPQQPSSFLTPAGLAETFDGRDLAAALIDEAKAVGSTFDLDIINDGSGGSGRDNYVEFEYVLSVCRGQSEEGREGTRRCIGPNGDVLQPVSRHLLAAATVRRGKGLLCTVSAPVNEWQQCEEKLRAVIRSFELF